MHIPRPAKLLFQIDDGWGQLLAKHGSLIPEWTKLVVERMLACGTGAMGVRRYCCASAHCSHTKYFCQSCKSKGCSACGMKATEQWIAEQQHILPDCEWQHITFTMPDKLWPAFASNWPLLNKLFACAANTLLKWAKKLDIEIGLFVALHTYGRQLNQHPHIHLSVTRGGLCLKYGVWRPVYFKKKIVERYWRQAVITLLRESYASLNLSAAGYPLIRDYREWCQFLEVQFQRRWKIHFAKKTKHARQNVNYLGRYLKRPPIAASKLRHYTGGAVVHHYYDHRTQQHRTQRLSQEEMLWRYISHIPSRHFKMVRYYGFLANRKRGELLPKVYTALGIEMKKKPQKPGFASLMKQFTNVDPYQCVLCGNWMVFNSAEAGIRAEELLARRRQAFKTERWLRQAA
ncbi:IS91 family transposase [Yersinia massiliensis]|uniref:IS91 family transposase n=2 Tax=Yersinia massiliensis TaxID=419257 RepID=A0ABM6V0D9_9GAMM|nr:IS91 family transposase [Yersinia massiliensis]AVX40587.1 IS91 family transposase [Yersinia massiliensis]